MHESRSTAPAADSASERSGGREHEDGGSRIDRRSILRSVGGVGYALGLSGVIGIDSALDAPDGTVDVETAYVRSPDSDHLFDEPNAATFEAVTREVPADWYERVETALDIHAKLVKTRIPGYLNSAVVPGTYDEGTARLSIGVRPNDVASLPRDLSGLLSRIGIDWGDSLDGIAIEIEEAEGVDGLEGDAPTEATQLVAHGDVDPIPGGVRCETNHNFATLTPALYRSDASTPLFGTALHAFPDWDAASGDELALPTIHDDEPRTIGHVVDALPDLDVAIARPARSARPGSVLGRNGSLPVVGQYTLWGLADLVARGEDVLKIGGTSGTSSGAVHGIDAATCVTTDRCRRGQLKWGSETDISDGDSGSVTVNADRDDVDGAIVASINSARTWWPGQDHVWGVAAHELTDRHGYHF